MEAEYLKEIALSPCPPAAGEAPRNDKEASATRNDEWRNVSGLVKVDIYSAEKGKLPGAFKAIVGAGAESQACFKRSIADRTDRAAAHKRKHIVPGNIVV